MKIVEVNLGPKLNRTSQRGLCMCYRFEAQVPPNLQLLPHSFDFRALRACENARQEFSVTRTREQVFPVNVQTMLLLIPYPFAGIESPVDLPVDLWAEIKSDLTAGCEPEVPRGEVEESLAKWGDMGDSNDSFRQVISTGERLLVLQRDLHLASLPTYA